MVIWPGLLPTIYNITEVVMDMQKQDQLFSFFNSNDTENPSFYSWCESRKFKLIQTYGLSYHRHRMNVFCMIVLPLVWWVVTYDSTLLEQLFYNRLMKSEDSELPEIKKKNIHQQLEEKPEELSDDSSDSDQSVVYKNDMMPTANRLPFVCFHSFIHWKLIHSFIENSLTHKQRNHM